MEGNATAFSMLSVLIVTWVLLLALPDVVHI